MGKQKEKRKGFGLRLTSAILFAIIAICMAIGCIFGFRNNYSSSFMTWFDLGYNHESINNDGTVQLISDKHYEDWDDIQIGDTGYGIREEPVYACVYSLVKTEDGVYLETDDYYFSSENAEAKTVTFKSENGEALTLSYENWQSYAKFQEYRGWIYAGDYVIVPIVAGCTAFAAILSVLLFVGAFAGRKHKWGNVISIAIGALTSPLVIGIFALAGGIMGRAQLSGKKPKRQPEAVQPKPRNAENELRLKALAAYPVDYENKPAVSQVLDSENSENLILTDGDGSSVEFRQLYVTVYRDGLYLVAETVDLTEEEGGGAAVFQVDYENDSFDFVDDDGICSALWEEYKTAASGVQYEKKQISHSEFVLDLYDTNVDEKTWKDFKKTASQEELTVIAIGAKYRVAHSRILNMICALGILLSVLLLFPTGGYSLIGYPIFAFLATKSIRYEDTYSQAYRKLSKENKAFVNGYYNSNIGLKILDGMIKIAIFYLTIPYQALMLAIGLIAPNFVVAKNGILVSLPKGFDVGNLGAVGAYYSSFSFNDFIDEALENTKTNTSEKKEESSPTDEYYKQDEYTYTDSHGYAQTVYTEKGGKDAYDAGGRYVGTIGEEGGGKKFTPAETPPKRDREEKNNSSKQDENDSE